MTVKQTKPKLTKKQKANRREWIKELRSGKFKQCKNRLESHDGLAHCCLGVACRIIKPAGSIGRLSRGCRGFALNDKMQDLFGLSSLFESVLSNLNDGGSTFKDIAKVIERDTNAS